MRPPGDVDADPDALRLKPEMVSFRGLVLAFVDSYINTWGQSPSYGEIAAATRSNRTRVKRAVASLEREGLLLRRKGTRGLSLPDAVEKARRTLERAGVPLPSSSGAVGQQGTPSVTNPTLLPPPALDYPSPAQRAARGHRENAAADNRSDRGAPEVGAPPSPPGV